MLRNSTGASKIGRYKPKAMPMRKKLIEVLVSAIAKSQRIRILFLKKLSVALGSENADCFFNLFRNSQNAVKVFNFFLANPRKA